MGRSASFPQEGGHAVKKLLAFGSVRRLPLCIAALLALVATCVALAAQWERARQDSMYEWYIKNGFAELNDLVEHFQNAQAEWMPLVPPGMPYMVLPGGLRYAAWENYPKDFIAGLVGVARGKAIVYPVIVYEDAKSRDYVFLNADGKEFYSVAPPRDYDSRWIVLARFPDLYTSGRSQEEIEALEWQYDPARVVLKYELASADAIEEIIKAQAAAAAAATNEPPMMLKSGGASISNIQFTAIENLTNGSIQVEISYPVSFTNRLDIFSVDSGTGLLDFWWDLRETTNVNTSTNYITWVDTDATNATGGVRFYAAANADLNNDTDPDDDDLTWGREKFLYHTSPTNSDTDADGYDDYEEVITMGTDPNNDDTNPPTVWMALPTNNTERIWLP